MTIKAKVFFLLIAIALVGLGLGRYSSSNSQIASATVALLLLVAVIAHLFSQTITQPLQLLTNHAREIAERDFQLTTKPDSEVAQLGSRSQDEISQLASSLQRMETELGQSIDRLKQTTAVKERMESELAIGRDIQMNMLTLTVPSFPKRNDLNLYATLLPAREVGGDFYDFYFFKRDTSYLYLLEGNRFCFCVGDVSGKGVPAALYMAVTKTLIKSQANIDLSPSKILSRVNQALSADNESCMFVTLFFGVLNLVNGELVYTNAGHNPPYIQRQDRSLTVLDKGHGPALGIVENLVYRESKIALQTGDILLAYTDGITEAMNPQNQLFSDDRLLALLKSRLYESSEDVVNATLEAVFQFQGKAEQADDVTLLAVQFTGQPEAQQDDLLELSIRDEVLSNLREQWEKH